MTTNRNAKSITQLIGFDYTPILLKSTIFREYPSATPRLVASPSTQLKSPSSSMIAPVSNIRRANVSALSPIRLQHQSSHVDKYPLRNAESGEDSLHRTE